MRLHAGQHKVYFVADALGRLGVPVTVLVPDFPENRDFLADRSHIEARFYKPGSSLGDAWRKTQAMIEGDWSAVWVVGVGIRSMMLRSLRRSPIVKDFDEFPSMIGSLGPFRRAYLKWIERRMIAQGDGFTCASAFLEQRVRARRPGIGRRLLRLPVAVSEEESRADPGLVDRLAKSASGRPLLLYAGSVSRFYEEQLDEIIAVAAVLKRRASPARVIIAGAGPDLDYFKAKSLAAGVGDSLEFVGHLNRERELPSYLEAAGALLFPFPSTAFNLSRCPTKAFHYAAANRPVVTNPVGEVATLLGDSAFYYPEGDVEAFASRCEEALRTGRRYHNRIPPESLTWKTRAHQLLGWLEANGWAPRASLKPPDRRGLPAENGAEESEEHFECRDRMAESREGIELNPARPAELGNAERQPIEAKPLGARHGYGRPYGSVTGNPKHGQ
jgi:glycosyltransferase involved in cell wall biosynthesis